MKTWHSLASLLVALVLLIAPAVSAQMPASIAPSVASALKSLERPTPVLGDVQRLTMQNKVLAAERAANAATWDALARAIADLVATRQRAAQQASDDMNAYYQSLSVEGYTLNPHTWVYEKKDGK